MSVLVFGISHSVSMKIACTVISRDWSKFDAVQYELELSDTKLATALSDDVAYLFSMYNRTLCRVDRQACTTAYDRSQKAASRAVVRRRVLCCETTGANSSLTVYNAALKFTTPFNPS